MKLFYDLLPVLLFFITYKLYNIYVATGVAIAAIVLQVGYILVRGKKPDMMNWVTLAMVVILGGATLLFRNEMFIKWKPTAVYWILGAVFLLSPIIKNKNLVQAMLEKSLTLPSKAWAQLNTSWYSFFFIMGILNLFVVYSFDTETWVNFKVFGTLILTVLFVVFQGILVSRYMPEKQEKQ